MQYRVSYTTVVMELMVIGVGILCGVLAYFWRTVRLPFASLAMLLHAVGSGMYFAEHMTPLGLVALFISVFCITNYARLVIHRLHARHLRLAFFVGGTRLLMLQYGMYFLDWLIHRYAVESALGSIVLLLQHMGAGLVLLFTVYRLWSSTPKKVEAFYSDKELPTVSVLLPARNESNDLLESLRSLVANDYPKLEILVLDDCSTSGRVPEIVREFAQDGVRFIQGDEPDENWLAKNQAYHNLAQSSSGEWLLFMGVDVRLGVGSVRALIHYALNHNAHMVSVLPRRYMGTFWAGFFTPLRYFKEMLKTGILRSNVPSLSTAWLIQREAFEDVGGMPSVARKVIPEHYFANRLSAQKRYAFVRSNDYLQIATAKSLSEQVRTSLRTLYPGLHRRMEWVPIVSMLLILGIVAPYWQLGWALQSGDMRMALVYGAIISMLTSAHLLVTTVTNPVLWPLAVINLPYLALQEVALYFISMYKYEFGTVIWKDRNICLPVLQAIPKLPSMKESIH